MATREESQAGRQVETNPGSRLYWQYQVRSQQAARVEKNCFETMSKVQNYIYLHCALVKITLFPLYMSPKREMQIRSVCAFSTTPMQYISLYSLLFFRLTKYMHKSIFYSLFSSLFCSFRFDSRALANNIISRIENTSLQTIKLFLGLHSLCSCGCNFGL